MESSFSMAFGRTALLPNPSRPLTRMMERIMKASAGSRRKKDNPVAKKRIRMIGLLNWETEAGRR